MNIVMPVKPESFSASQSALGTVAGRADRKQQNDIQATKNELSVEYLARDDNASKNTNVRFSQQTASNDKVHLSKEGKKLAQEDLGNTLTEEDQKKVQELKDRDNEVKVHEQAHAAAGGQYAGSPSYEYETGPDGKRYAISGEVSIDVSEEDTPEDTIQKMQIVRAAALAPAEPSSQDLKVASEAAQKENQARAQVSEQQLINVESKDATYNQEKNNVSDSQIRGKQAQLYHEVSAYKPSSLFSVSA